jgi:hypothetical protein
MQGEHKEGETMKCKHELVAIDNSGSFFCKHCHGFGLELEESICDCYKKAFLPVIEKLEEAAAIMWFKTPDYDEHQQKIHDIVVAMNTKFTCVDRCYR